jgi:two-component system, OmpR family, sensor histidine kinase MprB
MTLRARLVFVAAAAVAAAVALASVIVFFLVRNELRGQVNKSLENQAQQAANLPGRPFATRIAPHQYVVHVPALPFGNYFQFVDNEGNVYRPEQYDQVAPLLPDTKQAKAIAAGTDPAEYSDAHVSGQHVRILTTQITSNLAVQVAAPLSSVDHELATIKLWLFLVALGGVGLASIAGFLVARAALAPVRELSETAERVRSTRDLTQRIHIEGNDELSALAATFNGMLESLDDAARKERRLVQDASHELRTPLTSLRTNIELLASRGDDLPPEDRRQLLHDVVEQLGEMTVLIGELTELARGEAEEPAHEEVRLDLVTQEAIRRTTRNHPEVPIVARLDPTTIVGVPASLERAIGNLLDNAAKWSPSGREIDVLLADGELIVRDHGPGIADTDLPHIFERFYRATSARGMPGSGLGLAIVRQVAEAHGGTVIAESAPDGGTVMRLRLDGRNGSVS